MENLIVELKRTDDKVHFEGSSNINPDKPISFDYAPPIGSGDGFVGLEMLLMSFAGCVSTSVVFLAKRMGKDVSTYSVKAEGVRTENPLSLAEINFHVKISSSDLCVDDLNAIFKQAEMISPVWKALKNNVALKTSFELN